MREALMRLVNFAAERPDNEEYQLIAPGGRWGVIVKNGGQTVALSGIALTELD
jgi:hypothetical protein